MTELSDFTRRLPKAELHLHLEGTLEPELKFELARRNGIALTEQTVDEVRATYNFHDLASFLAIYYPAMQVLQKPADFADLAYAYLKKAASQGVRHAELFFDPQAHTSRGVPFSDVITGYRQAVVKSKADFDISADLILCILRDFSAEFAMATLMEALPYKDWIIGIGLDSDERNNPPAKFTEVFARAREEGFLLTMHCDIDQPNSIEHIRQVLQEVDVDRIDHGTNIVEDPELVAILKQKHIGLTCCPISNSFVTEDMKASEMLQLMSAGILVTVNSDDPAYFGGYVAENYETLADKLGLDSAALIQLARNSFEASWLSQAARDRYLAELDAFAAAELS